MKNIICVLCVFLMAGCTTVRYNGAENYIKDIDDPEVGVITTANIGDFLVRKGVVTEEKVLHVPNSIGGVAYTIPALDYSQVGFDSKDDFFSANGVEKFALADPVQGLAVAKTSKDEICVVTIYGNKACYTGSFSFTKRASTKSYSFQQTLIYSGKVGNVVKLGYREFSNDIARPAFNNDVEYDLSSSNIIGYKGASLEIIKADNTGITYKLLRNFR